VGEFRKAKGEEESLGQPRKCLEGSLENPREANRGQESRQA
jgi:hypothetical protein